MTEGGGYIAFASVALVRRNETTSQTIVSLATRDVAMRMSFQEHTAFLAALAFWVSGA